jgi:hypothetical protein
MEREAGDLEALSLVSPTREMPEQNRGVGFGKQAGLERLGIPCAIIIEAGHRNR